MLMNNNEYLDLVQTIKQEIQQAQYKATLSVNKELIMLYYNIGKIINEHKSWGNKFIENLAADIKLSFPNAKGYSVRNLKYMSKFASTYPDEQFVQTVSAQIPWSHNVAILDKVKGEKQREWYIRKTAENGWSHNVLIHQIESGLYERQAIADKISNFESRLASPQSELAVQTMKDPYIFDFIPFKEDIRKFLRISDWNLLMIHLIQVVIGNFTHNNLLLPGLAQRYINALNSSFFFP